jgi:hypothetical protein
MDNRNHFDFILLEENHFFYYLDKIWVHLPVSQILTGGSKDVLGREYMNAIPVHFCPMFYRCIMYKMSYLQLSVASREPFLLLSRPNWGSFTRVVLDGYRASYWSIDGQR